MPLEMQGRRILIKTGQDPYSLLKEAGDYCGPICGMTGDNAAVFFLLPIARGQDVHGEARSLHHVQSPPHKFYEEPDGSLTIRESIGAGHQPHYYWHGYLTKGRWQLNP